MSTLREHALTIWKAAVAAADPFKHVCAYLAAPDSPAARAIAAGGGVFVFGGGKAGAAMAQAVEVSLKDHLDQVLGFVNVPEGDYPALERIHLWPARPSGENHPTEKGVQGVEMQLALTELIHPEDLALCLLSGGGSALLPAPVEGITLADKQEVTRLLHACGATIDEMNCVRKHLSRYKGGRLGQRLAETGCTTVSLIVSDVVGDPLDVIASGPTAPDPTTFADAWEVLERYTLLTRVSPAVRQHLYQGKTGAIPDTPKTLPESIRNVLLCNNSSALAAASRQAETYGYRVLNLGSFVEGETRQVATVLAGIVRSIRAEGIPCTPPVCLLCGGETTVTLSPGHGKGGRNQEFVLACLLKLGPAEGVVILSGGTDGEDGPTDAAGALADQETWKKGSGLSFSDYLDRHDAYTLFEKTNDLIKTGLTHTNVMDVRVILIS